MLVTIITVALNSEKTIARTVESVLNQSYPQIEYILIDGASQDRTIAIAESYRTAFEKKEDWSFTVISEPDKGMYDALNKGAALAHGEIVGQINADDWYRPDGVAAMAQLYRQTGYDVAWGSLRMIGGKTWVKHAKIGLLWTTSGFCHPAMFSKREILQKYPYPLESTMDDFDFITAVHRDGRKILTVDKAIANFSFGQGGISTQKAFATVRQRVRLSCAIYKKYGMSRLYVLYRWCYEIVKYCFLRNSS